MDERALTLQFLQNHPSTPLQKWKSIQQMCADSEGQVVLQDIKAQLQSGRPKIRGLDKIIDALLCSHASSSPGSVTDRAKRALESPAEANEAKRQKLPDLDWDTVLIKFVDRMHWFENNQKIMNQLQQLALEKQDVVNQQEQIAKEKEHLAKEKEHLAKEKEHLAKEKDQLAKEEEQLVKEKEAIADRRRQLDHVYVKCIQGLDSRERQQEDARVLQETVSRLKQEAETLETVIVQRRGALTLEEHVEKQEYTLLALRQEESSITKQLEQARRLVNQCLIAVTQFSAGELTWVRAKSVLDEFSGVLTEFCRQHNFPASEAVCVASVENEEALIQLE